MRKNSLRQREEERKKKKKKKSDWDAHLDVDDADRFGARVDPDEAWVDGFVKLSEPEVWAEKSQDKIGLGTIPSRSWMRAPGLCFCFTCTHLETSPTLP